MLKIRRPLGRLIFNMGIAIPGKTVFLIETAPSSLQCDQTGRPSQYCLRFHYIYNIKHYWQGSGWSNVSFLHCHVVPVKSRSWIPISANNFLIRLSSDLSYARGMPVVMFFSLAGFYEFLWHSFPLSYSRPKHRAQDPRSGWHAPTCQLWLCHFFFQFLTHSFLLYYGLRNIWFFPSDVENA